MSGEIRETVGQLVQKAAKKISPLTFLSGKVRKMERDEIEALAVAYLMLRVKQSKRSAVAEVERRAKRPARPAFGTKAFEEWAAEPENEKAAADEIKWQEELEKINGQAARNLSDAINGAIDKFQMALRDQWTEELLAQEIALGDGTTVRWGEATADQHQQRFDMHMRNALAGAEGAARHKAAIETLRETGATNLYQAVSFAAAV